MDKEQLKAKLKELREVMKTNDDDIDSDQDLGVTQPPLTKEKISDKIIPLTKEFDQVVINNDFLSLVNTRTSKRKYTDESLKLEELAFLLWASQGVKKVIGTGRKATIRTVPSAGARHPFETYLFVNRVNGLEQGLYHYLPLEHALEFLGTIENQIQKVDAAYCGQAFFANAPVAFVWTVVPYRTEWRYTTNAQKYALLDAGHLCQNLYLASEAIGCGTCGIGAYEQPLADALLGLDSTPSAEEDNEFVVYAASVGRVEKKES
ncbi:SagB/ThcOx family dehydrogenase [Anaerocolumna sp. AGMB13025]|uniref:SagB/ThcOx family dehydrogenase n=1 Tax=Anaerocolumna sp. AGMB13025 TaxID=3039116 RepID=UPI00241FCA40|nr:SagB/ThcOx family dehydrogenase [Anaerocolumna sp. AGMB13025]WFR58793.1 SagB/ThcOx family dehydrogenase [Anaerocolumna sp. AGMB13025]